MTAPTTAGDVRFDQLTVGDRLPELVCGPLTPVHLMRWSAAIENWHRIHYDLPFATEHDGLPGLLINGSFKQHLIVQMLREWAEPTGWLFSVSFQFRKMDVAPSALTVWGVITGLRTEDDLGHVDLEIGIRNEAGEESTPGTAVVVLPLHSGTPVPYPYPVPDPTP